MLALLNNSNSAHWRSSHRQDDHGSKDVHGNPKDSSTPQEVETSRRFAMGKVMQFCCTSYPLCRIFAPRWPLPPPTGYLASPSLVPWLGQVQPRHGLHKKPQVGASFLKVNSEHPALSWKCRTEALKGGVSSATLVSVRHTCLYADGILTPLCIFTFFISSPCVNTLTQIPQRCLNRGAPKGCSGS